MLPLIAVTVVVCAPRPHPEPGAKEAEALVHKKLVVPLMAKDGEPIPFTRARIAPVLRRVRMADATPRADTKGHLFFAFSLDSFHGRSEVDEDGWRKNVVEGCVYVESKEIFVKRRDEYRPAAVLLGKKTKSADAHVCRTEELAAK